MSRNRGGLCDKVALLSYNPFSVLLRALRLAAVGCSDSFFATKTRAFLFLSWSWPVSCSSPQPPISLLLFPSAAVHLPALPPRHFYCSRLTPPPSSCAAPAVNFASCGGINPCETMTPSFTPHCSPLPKLIDFSHHFYPSSLTAICKDVPPINTEKELSSEKSSSTAELQIRNRA